MTKGKPTVSWGGDWLAEDGLRRANQMRQLIAHAAQALFFVEPPLKKADTAAFLPPQNDGECGMQSIKITNETNKGHPFGWSLFIGLRGMDLNHRPRVMSAQGCKKRDSYALTTPPYHRK